MIGASCALSLTDPTLRVHNNTPAHMRLQENFAC